MAIYVLLFWGDFMTNLPNGYIELEYIESTGIQYIDTGYHVTNLTKVELSCNIKSIPSAQIFLFGVTDNATGNMGRYGVTYISGNWRNVTADSQYDFPDSDIIGEHTILKDGNYCTIDGVSGNTTSSTNFTSIRNLPLFCRSQGPNLNAFASMQLFSCKIIEGEELVRNFIPCKNPDGIIGLYDLTYATFYSNSGTGNFIGGPAINQVLPDGYIELEYIESTGEQYIDTDYKPNNNTQVITKAFLSLNSTASWLFGARNGSAIATFGFLTYQNQYRSDYGTNQGQFINQSFSENFIIDKNKNVTTINGTNEVISPSNNFQCNYNLCLFVNNSGGNKTGYSNSTIYYFQIFENGQQIRNFIPCKNFSNEIGLYDLVYGTFYPNVGAGDFIAGPEVKKNTILVNDNNSLKEIDRKYIKINGVWAEIQNFLFKENGVWKG